MATGRWLSPASLKLASWSGWLLSSSSTVTATGAERTLLNACTPKTHAQSHVWQQSCSCISMQRVDRTQHADPFPFPGRAAEARASQAERSHGTA